MNLITSDNKCKADCKAARGGGAGGALALEWAWLGSGCVRRGHLIDGKEPAKCRSGERAPTRGTAHAKALRWVSLKSSAESCVAGEGDQTGQGRDGAQSPGLGGKPDVSTSGERLHSTENNFAAMKTGWLLSSMDRELAMTWDCPEYLTKTFS